MVQNMHHDVANTETMLVARSHSITVSQANIHCLKEGESFGGWGEGDSFRVLELQPTHLHGGVRLRVHVCALRLAWYGRGFTV